MDGIKFDVVVLNPPYKKSYHLKFLENGINLLSERGKIVIVEPATWLINVRETVKSKRYSEIKKKIDGHVEMVIIENLNNEFKINQFVPFSITTIDMSKTFEYIDFRCCGEHKYVKSIYDCNLIGEYKIIWSIINKVGKYGDFMKNHITNQNIDGNVYYTKYADIIGGNLCGGGYVRFSSDFMYRKHKCGEMYISYSTCGYHGATNNCISNKPVERRNRRGVKIEGSSGECVYGTREELENWKYFIFNNKLPLFINIVMTIDQHNNSIEYLPWLVDRRYTDDEIFKMFGLTEYEVYIIDKTIKKYERNSPWFKRYMCGKTFVSDDVVEDFIKKIS